MGLLQIFLRIAFRQNVSMGMWDVNNPWNNFRPLLCPRNAVDLGSSAGRMWRDNFSLGIWEVASHWNVFWPCCPGLRKVQQTQIVLWTLGWSSLHYSSKTFGVFALSPRVPNKELPKHRTKPTMITHSWLKHFLTFYMSSGCSGVRIPSRNIVSSMSCRYQQTTTMITVPHSPLKKKKKTVSPTFWRVKRHIIPLTEPRQEYRQVVP